MFRGFDAQGQKMFTEADRCTYCLREGHRASHCPSRRPADFASLAECAHYCRGECDPAGVTCFKGHKLHQIAEPERDAGVLLDEEDRKALGFVIAVVMTSLALVLVGTMVAQ